MAARELMSTPSPDAGRRVQAVHGRAAIAADPPFEAGLASHLRDTQAPHELLEIYGRFAYGAAAFDGLMRRVVFKALVRACGDGLRVGIGVGFKHPETFEIGSGVFIGDQAYLQGRVDGRCVIGSGTWIGPQSYFDARDLVLGEKVGWGPGARVLGSEHSGDPAGQPIIDTDLIIKPVAIGEGADIGVNAVILPGVTVGARSIVGAGAVVTGDVPPGAVVAGVPARLLRWREGYGAL